MENLSLFISIEEVGKIRLRKHEAALGTNNGREDRIKHQSGVNVGGKDLNNERHNF